MDREFNLLDEPWILVRDKECNAAEVSIRDALFNSHEYIELAGDTKTQDFAAARLLLALIYTVFSRYDADGNEIDLGDNVDFPVDNWERIWKDGEFPQKPFERYFEQWHDRFWLFDEEYPFYQSKAAMNSDKTYTTSKMIGTLFESNNKPRLFAERFGEGRSLSYGEAARWLLHIICFDDIAAKKPTPKKTWTAQLGLIAVKGENLFETLMLNYNADVDLRNEAYISKPSWERAKPFGVNEQIPVPDNQAELLSLVYRNVYLCRKDNTVSEYYLTGGCWFEETEVFSEQMTIWKGDREGKKGPYKFKPMKFSSSRMLWQEFGSIAVLAADEDNPDSGKRRAGILQWIDYLLEKDILGRDFWLRISAAAVIYDWGKTNCLPVIDSISDTLTFHSQFLLEAGAEWRAHINEEIDKCEEAAKKVDKLSVYLQKASGASGDGVKGDKAKGQYYSVIDRPLRMWLAGINPLNDDIEDTCAKFENQMRKITLNFGDKLAAQTGDGAVFGRQLDGVSSSAEAVNKFNGQINKIFILAGDEA